MTSFLSLNVLEAKIFGYNFLEGQNVWENDHYSSSTQRNVVAKMATKPEFLVAKGEMLVALATVSVAISSPVSLCRNLFLKISLEFPGGILGQANLR